MSGRKILESLGVIYDEQVLIDSKFVVDVLVPAAMLVVQWDGDYWHGYRPDGDERPLDDRQIKRKNLDRSQDSYMTKQGYRVVRYWEHQVRDTPNYVRDDIARRMELAANPTKRAAVAATKNKLDKPEDLPLFAMKEAGE